MVYLPQGVYHTMPSDMITYLSPSLLCVELLPTSVPSHTVKNSRVEDLSYRPSRLQCCQVSPTCSLFKADDSNVYIFETSCVILYNVRLIIFITPLIHCRVVFPHKYAQT